MKILLPNDLCRVLPAHGPLFFLAGPVRGGDDWQRRCCEEIRGYIQHFYAAIPCCYQEGHPLLRFRAVDIKNYFDRRTIWERHYLNMAATDGCIIFWLPCESKTSPCADNNPYAMDTRGELGEWRGRLMNDHNLRVVIGAEPDFPGLSQIQCNFNLGLGFEFPIYSTLSQTILAAIQQVKAVIL